MQEQLQKSITLLTDSLKMYMDAQTLLDNIDDVDAYIAEQKQAIQDAEAALNASSADFQAQRSKESANNHLISSLKVIDSVLSGANRDKQSLLE
jgi:hypothetical protein